ncbi:hypothetical protein [Corynebacterium aquilae]|uniref:hypothetical protein n=1 Tax=Corynebacterium aquilae TaxID=203263 RepID=UPI0009532BB2|nr:hypothetical protein [Corynebacterium aquilae]
MKARAFLATALCATLLTTTGCGHVKSLFEENPDEPQGAADLSATPTPTPVFQPKQVEPVVAETFKEPTVDPGLDVSWEVMGSEPAPYGGVVIHLNLKNLGEIPIPPDALGQAKLYSVNGVGNLTEIDPLDEDNSGVKSGLDLPLGAGATTTVDYAFNTTIGNLYQAELHVGNVIFKGNLNV